MIKKINIRGIGAYFPSSTIYNYGIESKYGYDINFVKNNIGFEN